MTTGGRGDLCPTTHSGRGIGMNVTVVGIGFGSVPDGTVEEHFVSPSVGRETDEAEREVQSTKSRYSETSAHSETDFVPSTRP